MDFKLVGKRIRSVRRMHKISQEQLAELIDCSSAHISHIENASTKHSLETLVAIANALHTTPDHLLCDSIYHATAVLTDEIAALFADASPDEQYVMLHTAQAAKEAMRIRKLKSHHE